MRHIQRLVLKNYRSLADIDLEMRPLNVLIGRNGSGKSNFLSFFDLMREGLNEELGDAIRNMGGFEEVRYYKHTDNPIEWVISLADSDRKNLVYSVQLNTFGNGGDYRVAREELYFDSDLEKDRVKFLSASGQEFRLLIVNPTNSEQVSQPLLSDIRELVIAGIRDRFRYPALAEVQRALAEWRVFHGFGNVALKNIRSSELLNTSLPLRLTPSGENLISVIQQLANNPEYEATYERLNDVMRAVFDDFKRLDIQLVAAGRGTLSYRSSYFANKSIPAQSMSDGQLRFLGLAVLLLLPNPPPLIAIDEPEIGMHPRMLPVFAELLKEASEQTQIVVSTHSPQLISYLKPEDVIVAEQDANGATTMRHLDTGRLKVWLESYSLGDLWTKGALEKVTVA